MHISVIKITKFKYEEIHYDDYNEKSIVNILKMAARKKLKVRPLERS